MTPLPGALSGPEVVAWRIDAAKHAATWDSGEGPSLHGGRWNRRDRHVVYSTFDPATAIVEVAVHIGFAALDDVPHVLTSLRIDDPSEVHVVRPEDLPDRTWLTEHTPTPDQQSFGEHLLERHRFVAIPSAVSRQSWNLLISLPAAQGSYRRLTQEPFVLDPRLAGARR